VRVRAGVGTVPPLTPCSRAANMRSVHTVGSIHAQRARRSPACVALAGTAAGLASDCLDSTPSTFLPPFAPRPLQALPRYYGGSDS